MISLESDEHYNILTRASRTRRTAARCTQHPHGAAGSPASALHALRGHPGTFRALTTHTTSRTLYTGPHTSRMEVNKTMF